MLFFGLSRKRLTDGLSLAVLLLSHSVAQIQGLFWQQYFLLLFIAGLWVQDSFVDYSQDLLGLSKRRADYLEKV